MLTKLFLASFGFLIIWPHYYIHKDAIRDRMARTMISEMRNTITEKSYLVYDDVRNDFPMNRGSIGPYLPKNSYDIHIKNADMSTEALAEFQYKDAFPEDFLARYTPLTNSEDQKNAVKYLKGCSWDTEPYGELLFYEIQNADRWGSYVILLINTKEKRAWHFYTHTSVFEDIKRICPPW